MPPPCWCCQGVVVCNQLVLPRQTECSGTFRELGPSHPFDFHHQGLLRRCPRRALPRAKWVLGPVHVCSRVALCPVGPCGQHPGAVSGRCWPGHAGGGAPCEVQGWWQLAWPRWWPQRWPRGGGMRQVWLLSLPLAGAPGSRHFVMIFPSSPSSDPSPLALPGWKMTPKLT